LFDAHTARRSSPAVSLIVMHRIHTLLVLVVSVCCLVPAVHAQNASTAPAEGLREHTPRTVAFTNATIVVSPDRTIERGTLVIRDGRITTVGKNAAVPADAVVVDATGLTIYPGFIDPFSDYGVTVEKRTPRPGEDEYPHPTIDRKGSLSWNGAVHAERNAATLFAPDDKVAGKLRAQGFALANVQARDGIFRGISAVVTLGMDAPNALIVPSNAMQCVSFSKGSSIQDFPGSLMGSIALLRQMFMDAQWYEKATAAYARNPKQDRPETNNALAALLAPLHRTQRLLWEAGDEKNLLRAKRVAVEFGLDIILKGDGVEYRRIDAIQGMKTSLIIPVAFPDPPDVSTAAAESQVPFVDLKTWDEAPDNPKSLERAGVNFAFTTAGLKEPSKFWENIRKAVKRGLSEHAALAALTTVPAAMCGIETVAGTIEEGKAADIVIASGSLFEQKSTIYSVYIDGKKYEVTAMPEAEPRGTWELGMAQGDIAHPYSIEIAGERAAPEATIVSGDKKTKAKEISISRRTVTLSFNADSVGGTGMIRLSGLMLGDSANGYGVLDNGQSVTWWAVRKSAFTPKPDTTKPEDADTTLFPVTYPDHPYGRLMIPSQPRTVAITHARVWTAAASGTLDDATVVFGNGKIIAVGKDVSVPSGATVIDGKGKDVTPGIIDEHSHIAIDGDVNEGSQAISAEVRIGDVVDCDDINIYRQLGGGTTISHLLHGSANPIGGQCQVVKHRWGLLPEEMKIPSATPSIKFALGENVKQSNWGDKYSSRYPQTRMGVEAIMRDEFQTAQEYDKMWKAWTANPSEEKIPPRRDIELDAINEVIHGQRSIHCHSYVQSEILMLMRLAEDFNFKIGTFTHILEGYKVGPEMRDHGAMASSFADWWDYKFEVYDAIPQNPTMLANLGIVTSINSDDAEMGRRLNQEAAKAVKYGGLPESEAIKLCTINPAKQLGIDNIVGSVEPGKDADLVIWDASPLSAHAKVLQTWMDGRRYFDRDEDAAMRNALVLQRAALVKKAAAKKGGDHSKPSVPKRESGCEGYINN
jgi:imidazolonepropionase-like amidohydrolase